MSKIDDIKFNLNANVYANDGDGIAREDVTYLLSENERLTEIKSEEESDHEHNKSMLALEQEIEGWKSANRILKARLEIAVSALTSVANAPARETMRRYAEKALDQLKINQN